MMTPSSPPTHSLAGWEIILDTSQREAPRLRRLVQRIKISRNALERRLGPAEAYRIQLKKDEAELADIERCRHEALPR